MRYRVMVNIDFGYDDTLDAEYTGRIHDDKKEAEKELKKAKEDPTINYAYIEKL